MNSLVVFLSLVALAAAKPSGVITYAAPVYATLPAAVSSQSRIDIKSSPAFVATAAVAPIARTVIAQPAIVAPAAIAAPAAVSHQSRIDIKSSPAVVSNVVSSPYAAIAPAIVKTFSAPAIATAAYAAPAIAAPAFVAPAIAPAFAATGVAYAAPALVKTVIAEPVITAPAAIAAPTVPLDTPEVIAARAAHFEAKSQITGAHFIHKRSVLAARALTTYAASPIYSTYAAAPIVHSAPLAYSAPLTYSPYIAAPFVAKAYSVHPY